MTRTIPPQALALVKRFEGFSPCRLPDEARAEIGYGHDMEPGDPLWNATISEATAEELAEQDLETTADELTAILGPQQVSLFTDGQWAALLDFTYNLGSGTFASSTLRAMIKAGRLQAAGGQFNRWVYAKDANGVEVVNQGLAERRDAETEVWES